MLRNLQKNKPTFIFFENEDTKIEIILYKTIIRKRFQVHLLKNINFAWWIEKIFRHFIDFFSYFECKGNEEMILLTEGVVLC